MVMTHAHAKIEIKGQLIRKTVETNGRTQPIALPFSQTQFIYSVYMHVYMYYMGLRSRPIKTDDQGKKDTHAFSVFI